MEKIWNNVKWERDYLNANHPLKEIAAFIIIVLVFWVPEKKLESCKVKATNLRTSCIVAAACSTALFPHCHFSKVRTAKYYYYYYFYVTYFLGWNFFEIKIKNLKKKISAFGHVQIPRLYINKFIASFIICKNIFLIDCQSINPDAWVISIKKKKKSFGWSCIIS
jgi:hypothetical protein